MTGTTRPSLAPFTDNGSWRGAFIGTETDSPTGNPEKTLSLPDGRLLGYAEYGDPQGYPLFLFHGVPGSRFQRPSDTITRSAGIRLLVVERPGFGLSSFKPSRTLLDWPSDLLALADSVKASRFGVLGLSAGGPYAAACAALIHQRISGAIIVSGLGALDTPGALRTMPIQQKWLFTLGAIRARKIMHVSVEILRFLTKILLTNPRRNLPVLARLFPEPDRDFFRHADGRRMFLKDLETNYLSGAEGIVQDLSILSNDWGFDPETISATVTFWHGDRDLVAPTFLIHNLAQKIPRATEVIIPGEGHLLIFRYWKEILSAFNRSRTKQD